MFNSGWLNQQHNEIVRRERMQEAEDFRRAQEIRKGTNRDHKRDSREHKSV